MGRHAKVGGTEYLQEPSACCSETCRVHWSHWVNVSKELRCVPLEGEMVDSPGCSSIDQCTFLPFFKEVLMYILLQFSETCPEHHNLLKML